MRKITITDIDWDVDCAEDLKSLPKKVSLTIDESEFSCDDMEEIEEYLSDFLSDTYGYCHKGFKYNFV